MNAKDLRPIENHQDAMEIKLPERPALRRPPEEKEMASRYPLRGQPVRLIDPTKPVSADEWEADQ